MRILFICKYNRFRSKVAEAIFNHHNNDKSIEVKSAGISRDVFRHYVAKPVHNVMDRKRIKINDEVGQKVNDYMLKWADKIIIVADNVNPEIFPKDKVEIWPIKDCDDSEEKKIKETVNDIENRVKELIDRLKQ